ncbi:MAG: SDR family oxidoreductase [Pseudomonadales bacterium]|nr:SDR family oxidoreductase [Pseudomonadales bacterium]
MNVNEMTQSKSVLLVGCGDIGLQLGEVLTQQGFSVHGLRRNPPAQGPFEFVKADLLDPLSLECIQDTYDFIVYTATPSKSTPEAYEAIYVQGLKNLMAAVDQPRERFFLVSSTGVYHQTLGEWVDESSATEPVRFSGQTLLKAEQLASAGWSNTTVVRFAGIYGPGRLRLVKKIQQGCTVVETPPKYTNRIHRDDCAGLLQFLMAQVLAGENIESIYTGVDSDPGSEAEVLDFIATQLQLPIPAREEAPSNMSQNKRCCNDLIVNAGYRFKFPSYKEGYLDILQKAELI